MPLPSHEGRRRRKQQQQNSYRKQTVRTPEKRTEKNRSLTCSFTFLNNNSLDTSPSSPPPSREEAEEEEEEAAKPKSSSKVPQASARAYKKSKRTDSEAFRVWWTTRTNRQEERMTPQTTTPNYNTLSFNNISLPFLKKITFINSQLIRYSRKAN